MVIPICILHALPIYLAYNSRSLSTVPPPPLQVSAHHTTQPHPSKSTSLKEYNYNSRLTCIHWKSGWFWWRIHQKHTGLRELWATILYPYLQLYICTLGPTSNYVTGTFQHCALAPFKRFRAYPPDSNWRCNCNVNTYKWLEHTHTARQGNASTLSFCD